ncbi:hypothetical protein HMPREF9412_4046 [Paenibacillus sp. HGF5]|nr:hypothetical protein HMPREF9412_4046 [Paenibacillus sp. HGF5]
MSFPSAFRYDGMRDSGCQLNAARGGPLSQPGDTLVEGEDVTASSFFCFQADYQAIRKAV